MTTGSTAPTSTPVFATLTASGERAAAPNRGQWGLTQDDRGRLYYNTNSNPLRGDLFPGRYRLRNPELLGAQSTNYEIAPSKNIRVFPGRITPA